MNSISYTNKPAVTRTEILAELIARGLQLRELRCMCYETAKARYLGGGFRPRTASKLAGVDVSALDKELDSIFL